MAMSRPEKVGEVKDRYNEFATLELSGILTNPALMKHYSALAEAVKKEGGRARKPYGTTIHLELLKTGAELAEQLAREQRHWDEMDRDYSLAFNRKPGELGAQSEWAKERVQEWAKAEGRPDPWGIALHDDPELDELRQSLGMDQ